MASVEPGASAATWRSVAAIASVVSYMLTPVDATTAGRPASKPDADALALNIYVTNSTLAGNAAASYGFAVSSTGLGGSTANVGAGGAAFGINDNTVMTITELLSRANARARKGTLWDANADGSLNSAETILRNQVYSLFETINNA